MARTDKKLFQMGADEAENIQRAEELFQYLAKHTLTEGVAWVKEKWGVDTSLRAMSEFRRDWPTEQVIFRLQGRIVASRRIVEAGGEEVQSLTPTNLNLLEQQITELLATGADHERLAGFVKMFAELTKASVSTSQARLDMDKFHVEVCNKFLDWFSDEQARDIAESNQPKAEKIAALRKTYFADVDAMEKSGKVVLPS
jgi:hypothetical protein